MKECSNCGITKKLLEFSKNTCKCKECKKIWRQQWRQQNKDKIKIKQKSWREQNPDYQKEWKKQNPDYQKEWKKQNPNPNLDYQKSWREQNSDYQKEWQKNSKDKLTIYRNNYYQQNKDKAKIYYQQNKDKVKIHYQQNKEQINDRANTRHKERYHTDSVYRLKSIIRASIGGSIKNAGYIKISKTQEILGCTFDEFKDYIQSKFEDWMTWENQGLFNGTEHYGWDLDHIIPISSAVTEDDVLRLNHYTNFQPLCSLNNRYIKRNIFIDK